MLVTVGLHIVPFAGIAFLWNMSATRTLIEAMPGALSEMPRWLQLGSGIVFVCLLFTGTAAVGAVALLTVFSSAPLPPPDVARALTSVGYGMVFVFGVRAAGMFIIATTTLLRSRALSPRWLAVISYLAAGFLLVSTTFHPVVLLVLPGWVAAVSPALTAHSFRKDSPLSTSAHPAPNPRTPAEPAGDPGGTPPPHHPRSPRRRPPMSMTIDLDDIPGPKGRPIVGNALDIDAENPIETFLDMARDYGPIFKISVPTGTRIFVSGPDLVEEVCDDARFDKMVEAAWQTSPPWPHRQRPVHLRHRRPPLAARAQHPDGTVQRPGHARLHATDAGHRGPASWASGSG